jgi:hypothetical protein
VWNVLQFVAGLIAIAGMLALQGAALYLIYWLVLLAFRRVPMIGKRHRHRDWDRLNRSD